MTTRLLFVCMGNICRSPMAEGMFGHLARAAGLESAFTLDSAGTHDYHVGLAPDARAQAHAGARGVDISRLRARQLAQDDFARFDRILVMDDHNWRAAHALCPIEHRARIHRLSEYCTRHKALNVADPYYGGDAGFERALDIIEDACKGLLADLSPH